MSGLSFNDGLPLECERLMHALRRVSRRICFAGSMGGLTLLGGLPCFARTFDDPLWARAPLNTDITLLDAPPVLQWALLSLAVLINMAVLAGILYAVARHEAEFSYFALVYLGVLVGGLLASLLLSPLILAAPLLFKKIERVEANMFVFFIALLLQALLERRSPSHNLPAPQDL